MAEAETIRIAIAPDQNGERTDRALVTALQAAHSEFSRTRLKALIEAGAVRVETSSGILEAVDDPSRRVRAGQIFAIILPKAEPATIEGQAIALTIVYEDEDVIVVDKPAGMVVHPAPGNPDHTLVNALIAHCGASLAGIGGVKRPGIVHRLDKDTSGLIVAAKTELAHRELVRQFAARSVERVYAALVWGVPQPRRGEISGAIGRSRTDRKKMAVVSDGRPALTRYEVKATYQSGAVSLVDCRLATGRTHQIRVHLASQGHPLLGDPVYGRARRKRALTPAVAAAVTALGRQALDAYRLGFIHPRSRTPLSFQKNLPLDIARLIAILEDI